MMHSLRRFQRVDGSIGYRLGYYDPAAIAERWQVLGEVDTLDEALEWVSYLNGGSKPLGPIKPP
jgi:hypothetical protein